MNLLLKYYFHRCWSVFVTQPSFQSNSTLLSALMTIFHWHLWIAAVPANWRCFANRFHYRVTSRFFEVFGRIIGHFIVRYPGFRKVKVLLFEPFFLGSDWLTSSHLTPSRVFSYCFLAIQSLSLLSWLPRHLLSSCYSRFLTFIVFMRLFCQLQLPISLFLSLVRYSEEVEKE